MTVSVDLRRPINVDLGRRIELARENHGWTQNWLAIALGCSRDTVRAWERGYDRPSAYQLIVLAKLLGLDLVDQDKAPPRPAPSTARECANDGRPFNSADPDARYCRPACQAAAIRREQRRGERSRPCNRW